MFSLNSKSTKNVIGVDISSTSVKLIQIGVKNGKYQVDAYNTLPLADGDVVDKNIINPEGVAETLERVVNLANPNVKQVAMAVPTELAITKIIFMDADLNDSERELQIRMDAEQYIPYPLDEVSLDFEIVKKHAGGKVDVLLVATRTENVDRRVEVLELAGLKPAIMDVESYALERSFELLEDSLPIGTNVVAVVDIGHTFTTINVLENGKVIYSREESIGGKQLTQGMQRFGYPSLEEAEQAKKEGHFPVGFDVEVLYPFMEDVADKAARSLQLFYSNSKHSKVDHLLLAGGCANISWFPKVLQERLNCRVTLANPFLGMTYAPQVDVRKLENDAPSLLVATGLALRSTN